jgi:hypothetical protein
LQYSKKTKKSRVVLFLPKTTDMLEYTVAFGDSLNQLIQDVNDKLKEGWELQGGVASSWTTGLLHQDDKGFVFTQAMVRKSA